MTQIKPHIFIVNGFPLAGKDEFLIYVKKHICLKSNKVSFSFSSVDRVKEAGRILGWDGEKTEQNRNFLSELKDLSTLYFDGPFNYITGTIEKYDPNGDKIIFFVMVREPKEITKLKNYYGEYLRTILVRREKVELDHLQNTGDSNVLDFDYDFTIDNNGTLDDLRIKAYKFVEENFC